MVDSIQDFRKLAYEKSTGALRSPRKKHRVPTWRLPTWIWKVPWSWPMIFMDPLSTTPKLEWFDCVWSIGLPSLFRNSGGLYHGVTMVYPEIHSKKWGILPGALLSDPPPLRRSTWWSALIRGHWKSRHTKDPKDPKAWWIESVWWSQSRGLRGGYHILPFLVTFTILL